MKLKVIEVENAIKNNFSSVLEQLNQRHSQRERVLDYDDNDEYLNDTAEYKELSTQFFQMQKKRLFDLKEHFERYCKTLPFFGFNDAKYDIDLIKSYLLPIFVNERQIEPTVIKKANQFVSFKFGDMQLLHIMNFLGGELLALTRSSSLTKQKRLKIFSPMNGSTIPKSWTKKNYLHKIPLFSKLRNVNPVEKDYSDFENLTTSGLSSRQALCELRLNKTPPTCDENYAYLRSIWVRKRMKSFEDFLMRYKNNDVVPTLQAMQKVIELYHQKEIDKLKLGCTLPNMANICLHKSIDSKFYPFIESDKELLKKLREDMVRGPSIIFTRKAVVHEIFLRKLQINKFVQVTFRYRRKPTLSLFDVSTNAYWVVYKMEPWLWISKPHASTEQSTFFRKYALFLFSTNYSGM